MPSLVEIYFHRRIDAHSNPSLTTDADVRQYFEIPPNKRCCDGAQHLTNCPFILAESKSASHIIRALRQLETTAEYVEKSHTISHCVIVCTKLDNFYDLRRNLQHLLYNRETKKLMRVNKKYPVEIIYREELLREKKRRKKK